MEPGQVVILAGGLGTRVRHLTGDLPKALLPIRGEPFVHHQLRLLRRQRIRDVVFVTGYRGASIREAVGTGEAFGLSVSFVDEGEALHGTAGALRVALDAGVLSGSFGVLYGDSYLPIAFAPVWAAFAEAGRPALMTVLRNDNRWDRSNAVLEGRVVTLYDKRPDARRPGMAWIDYGLGVLDRRIVEALPAGEVVDLADVYRDLSLRGELAGFEVTSRFYEVGSPEGVADLERYLAGDA